MANCASYLEYMVVERTYVILAAAHIHSQLSTRMYRGQCVVYQDMNNVTTAQAYVVVSIVFIGF
jgi:hypothetical protein